ncbi:hypothetical protein KTAU_11880 [Thermogemmatispora aurantia]|uniref:Uncharacterized protein n=1 Tax=Thermogemmatispora aurantia TaxID=2045279 RepID=A0A5J4K779_9CHLR|nr:hypothetical protein KTAU_11880 [Thermogemmatispora aurantia]
MWPISSNAISVTCIPPLPPLPAKLVGWPDSLSALFNYDNYRSLWRSFAQPPVVQSLPPQRTSNAAR